MSTQSNGPSAAVGGDEVGGVAPSGRRQRWLALAGPVSGYTWELFAQIVRRSGVQLDVFHSPPDARQIRTTFAHESFQGSDSVAHDWVRMSPRALLRTMDVSRADAILLFGTRSKIAMTEALIRRSRQCPLVFVGDTNVADVFPENLRGWTRLFFYRAIARFVTEAWTLGRSNEQAFRLLGFRRLRTLPFYAVTYAELGRPRANVLPAADGHFNLLAIARLAPEKNLETLIRALGDERLRDRVRLTIVGDGPSRREIEALLRVHPALSVRLAGSVPHASLGPYFERAHALVLPSRYEPWGNVVTEALGMGIPVLATPEVGAATSSAGRYSGVRISDGSDDDGLRRGVRELVDGYATVAAAAVDQAPQVRAEFDVGQVAGRMIEAIAELQAMCARRPG